MMVSYHLPPMIDQGVPCFSMGSLEVGILQRHSFDEGSKVTESPICLHVGEAIEGQTPIRDLIIGPTEGSHGAHHRDSAERVWDVRAFPRVPAAKISDEGGSVATCRA